MTPYSFLLIKFVFLIVPGSFTSCSNGDPPGEITVGPFETDFCRNNRGDFDESCKLPCDCANGGSCTPDGCLCPDGWTGMDCSFPQEETRSYFIGFLENYRRRNSRKVYLLSQTVSVNTIVQVMRLGSPTEPLDGKIQPLDYTTLEFPVEDAAIADITMSPDCSAQVIGVNEEQGSMDVFSAIPVNSGMGQEYIAVSTATSSFNNKHRDSSIDIIAAHDNTSVEINFFVNAVVVEANRNVFSTGSATHHQTFLNKYQTLTITSPEDLTGTRIIASSGLSVFSGHECGHIDVDSEKGQIECNHLVEQMPPTSLWGTEYIVTPFLGRTGESLVKIVAARDGTEVSTNCMKTGGQPLSSTVEVIDARKSHEFHLHRDTYCKINSSNPILVTHFNTARGNEDIGASSMVLVPDVDKPLRNISFMSFDTEDHKFHHFITFVIKGSHPDGAVLLDGSPIVLGETAHELVDFGLGEMFLVVRMSLKEGYHHLQHKMFGRLFGLIVYGFTRNTAYSYSMGYHQGAQCTSEEQSNE